MYFYPGVDPATLESLPLPRRLEEDIGDLGDDAPCLPQPDFLSGELADPDLTVSNETVSDDVRPIVVLLGEGDLPRHQDHLRECGTAEVVGHVADQGVEHIPRSGENGPGKHEAASPADDHGGDIAHPVHPRLDPLPMLPKEPLDQTNCHELLLLRA